MYVLCKGSSSQAEFYHSDLCSNLLRSSAVKWAALASCFCPALRKEANHIMPDWHRRSISQIVISEGCTMQNRAESPLFALLSLAH